MGQNGFPPFPAFSSDFPKPYRRKALVGPAFPCFLWLSFSGGSRGVAVASFASGGEGVALALLDFCKAALGHFRLVVAIFERKAVVE